VKLQSALSRSVTCDAAAAAGAEHHATESASSKTDAEISLCFMRLAGIVTHPFSCPVRSRKGITLLLLGLSLTSFSFLRVTAMLRAS